MNTQKRRLNTQNTQKRPLNTQKVNTQKTWQHRKEIIDAKAILTYKRTQYTEKTCCSITRHYQNRSLTKSESWRRRQLESRTSIQLFSTPPVCVRMSVCVCVRVYTYICIYIYVYTYACIFTYKYVSMCMRIYEYIQIYTYK